MKSEGDREVSAVTKAPRTIIVVDDDPTMTILVEAILSKEGFRVVTFDGGEELLEVFSSMKADCLVTDLMMERMGGFDILSLVGDERPGLPVVVLTGSRDISDAVRAMREGAADYVTKPINGPELVEVVRRAVRIAEIKEENRRYLDELRRRDERMAFELGVAERIQRNLLPSALPSFSGFEFALDFLPSGTIGGDFFDFVRFREENLLGIVFTDISGHGVPAALLSAIFKIVSTDVLHGNYSPEEALSIINARLAAEFPPGGFASTFYVVIDNERMALNYAKASQEPGILLRASGEIEILDEGGPLLGAIDPDLFGPPEYLTVEKKIGEGDILLLYTDGLIEIENPRGDMLGFEGLIGFLGGVGEREPGRLVESLRRMVTDYVEGEDLVDDLMVLVVRRNGGI